ncbi:MAG: ABC transporter ATP-binding protein/permease, partial [Candidatus Cloacimonetes bacterium]|nr:ABC transporter ATP-binding protein/permease [Candidatus Cloacimonadota bacterium]
ITMVIPVFDYIFAADKTGVIYSNYAGFSEAISASLTTFWQSSGFTLHISAYNPLFEDIGEIMKLTDSYLLLKMISITVILLILLKNIFFFAQRMMVINLRGKTVLDIRNSMFENYLRQSFAFFGKQKVGDALVRMINDLGIVSNQLIIEMFTIARDVIQVLIFVRIAIYLNPRLFLIGVVIMPVFMLFVGYISNKIKKYARRMQNQLSELFSSIEEILANIRIVIAFSRQKDMLGKVRSQNKKHFKFWRKGEIYNATNVPLTEVTTTAIGVLVLIYGGKMVLDPSSGFSFGHFSTFLLAIFAIMQPIKAIGKAYLKVTKAMVSLNRIYEVLDLETGSDETTSLQTKKEFNKSIELRDVGFSYDGKKKVLSGINLIAAKGEKIAFVGGSGAGKTTLVNLLPRFYDATEGEILIDGISQKDIRLPDLRNLFGIVTQESILFSDTVAENIRFGGRGEINEEQLRKATVIANADEFINEMENGFDTLLDIKGGNISGGQKQRLCIARAIVGNPPILIFDEATSALDTESERKVQTAIENATRNRTVFLIAHRLSTILKADKIVVMEKGQIVGMGRHEELLKTSSRYLTLYNLQFAVEEQS